MVGELLDYAEETWEEFKVYVVSGVSIVLLIAAIYMGLQIYDLSWEGIL